MLLLSVHLVISIGKMDLSFSQMKRHLNIHLFLTPFSLQSHIPQDSSKEISEVIKVCSPEIQGCGPSNCQVDTFLQLFKNGFSGLEKKKLRNVSSTGKAYTEVHTFLDCNVSYPKPKNLQHKSFANSSARIDTWQILSSLRFPCIKVQSQKKSKFTSANLVNLYRFSSRTWVIFVIQ